MSLQIMRTNYKAELTPEEFKGVQTSLREMGEYLHKS